MQGKNEKMTVLKGESFYAEVCITETDSQQTIVIRHFNREQQVVRTIESALLSFEAIEMPMRVLTQYGMPPKSATRKVKTATGGGGHVFVE